MPVLLRNATYVDWESLEFFHTNIVVDEGINKSIHLVDDLKTLSSIADYQQIDCHGKLVTKAFAVGHHHAYSAMARGMPAPRKQPEDFYEILKYVWWTLDKCLDRDTVELSALVTARSCAKAGSTFIIDHHASPSFIHWSLEVMAKAFERVGLSHLLCYEITDRDGMDKARQGLTATEEYLKTHQGLVGLHASFTVGDETLKQATDLMQRFNSGIHVHVAEDMHDQNHCQSTYKKRVIHRFSEAGITNSAKTILVHCLHLDDEERRILHSSPCRIVQNTESNLNNNVGFFSGKSLGNNIMLGTDGMHSDMLQSAKAAYFVGQRFDPISPATAYRRFRNVHHYLADNGFRGDGANNLVVLNYNPPTEINRDNFYGHFIFGINASHVQHVISNGKAIVLDQKMTTVDEDEIMSQSREQAKRLWNLMKRL